MNYQEFYNKLTLVNKIELILVFGLGSYGMGIIISNQNIPMGIAIWILGVLYFFIILRQIGYFNFDKKEEIKFSGNDLSNESK